MAVPKPGYGLSNPNKSITLPNSARYAGLSSHQSYEFDTSNISNGFYCRDISSPLITQEAEKMNIYNIRQNFYVQSSKSTPNLIGEPKIYDYSVLKRNRKTKLPMDVDRERLERHLNNEQFEEIFGMDRQTFYELPEWKRIEYKKIAKLF